MINIINLQTHLSLALKTFCWWRELTNNLLFQNWRIIMKIIIPGIISPLNPGAPVTKSASSQMQLTIPINILMLELILISLWLMLIKGVGHITADKRSYRRILKNTSIIWSRAIKIIIQFCSTHRMDCTNSRISRMGRSPLLSEVMKMINIGRLLSFHLWTTAHANN